MFQTITYYHAVDYPTHASSTGRCTNCVISEQKRSYNPNVLEVRAHGGAYKSFSSEA